MDFKIVPIGESEYRIGRLLAADGSWLYTTFLKRYRDHQIANPPPPPAPVDPNAPPAVMPSPEVGFLMTASFLVEQFTRAELAEVQGLCLASCARFNSSSGSPQALPLLLSDGRYTAPSLEYDGPTVLELIKQSIAFNIAPYFPGAGSNGATTPADSSLPSTQP